MANDFDEFPVYDPIVDQDSTNLSNVWVGAISTFYMNLIGYLTQDGILLPQLTTIQRDELISPQNGQVIYNTTLGTAQYFKAGSWVSF
jgi:hypothetical protein